MTGRRRMGTWPAAFALAAVSCGFSAKGSGDTDEHGSSSSTGSTSADPVTTMTASGTSQTSTTSTTQSTTDTTTSTTTDASGSTGPTPELGCPSPLPDSWIYCQDFEQVGDPFEEFDPYFFDATNFEVDNAAARSGARSLRWRYTEVGDTWSGEAWIRFGDAGNAGPVFASAQVFDEIWARVWVRTQDGWPGGGYGEVLEISAREGPQGARVATVVAGGDPMQNYLGLQARTCIDAGMLQCDGMMDWQTDRFLAGSGGSTIINDPEQGPQWHCIVMHVQLNQAGMTDGFASLIVDGVEDVVLYDLDLRGTWDQTGLNTVRINSSWPGGATGTVERYMDDIVIANAPLECP